MMLTIENAGGTISSILHVKVNENQSMNLLSRLLKCIQNSILLCIKRLRIGEVATSTAIEV